MIPYGRQTISEDDIGAVVEVLRSKFLTQGPTGRLFEEAVANHCGARYAVATSSATSALHLACLALGVGEGDRVWTSAITFVASANCARYCGAVVDFVDIDRRTYNMSTEALEEKLQEARKTGRLPKLVIPVHLAGQSCDMQTIHQLAAEYGFRVLEDASHALGGEYRAEPVGSCRFSDAAVFSFHPVKQITTGEGGMLLTNDGVVSARSQLLRTHGITRDIDLMIRQHDGPWYYEQVDLGFNYRMSDLQAALGLSQLRRLEEFVDQRRQIADRYDHAFSSLRLIRPWQSPQQVSPFHLYIIRTPRDWGRIAHRRTFEYLRGQGIGVNLHYIPLYRQPYFGIAPADFERWPEAESYYKSAMSLPIYPRLDESTQALVVDKVVAAIEHGTSN